MEVFGGFMMMASILGFFLTVIWFILPFVIFSIKGKVDRTLLLAEETERRLAAIEARQARLEEIRTPQAEENPGTSPATPATD